MDETQIKHVVEAALLAAGRPLPLDKLASLFASRASELDKETLQKAIDALASDYKDRGLELKEVSTGYRIQIRRSMSDWLTPLWDERAPRYTRALLETLALVAYRQPITRAEIEEVRGVAVSTNIMRTLLERSWVRVVGHRDVPGKPAMFGTTKEFLDYFGLKKLEDLPPLADVKDGLPELTPQSDLIDALAIDGDEIVPDDEALAEGVQDDEGVQEDEGAQDDETSVSQVVDGAAAENVGEDGADAARVALGADEVHSNLHIDNADDDDAAEDDEYGQDEAEDADEADDSDADDADDADEADETDEADNVDDLDEVVSREPSHTETTSDLDDEDNEEVQAVVAHATGAADDEADQDDDENEAGVATSWTAMVDSDEISEPADVDGINLPDESADDWTSERSGEFDAAILDDDPTAAALDDESTVDESTDDESTDDEVREADLPLSRTESS